MSEIRVALIGVGNSASALIQGVQYYKDAKENTRVPGLMHVNFGGYHIKDIKFVAAFEVNKDKIGKDLSEAIFLKPNCCVKFSDVPKLNVKVSTGPILDGVAEHMKGVFNIYDEKTDKIDDVVKVLKDTRTDVLVNYLPVGSRLATRFYAQAAIDAGCAIVNCMPEFIASDHEWSKKFESAGLPVKSSRRPITNAYFFTDINAPCFLVRRTKVISTRVISTIFAPPTISTEFGK